MSVAWPDPEQRERYVQFLTLELRVLKSAAGGEVDPELLSEFSALFEASFPRTRAFIESRLPRDPAKGFSDEIRAVAWAEARATPAGSSEAVVPGEWTREQIARDINDCFQEAKERAGL
ncbi:MAG: hypothetical protein ACYC99_01525 [Candidatus Geothermincolia bacterium]